MHIPFSMSDEPDLGDEFRGYTHEDNYNVDDPFRGVDQCIYSQRQIDELIRKSIRMKNEAYQEGYNKGLDEGYIRGYSTAII